MEKLPFDLEKVKAGRTFYHDGPDGKPEVPLQWFHFDKRGGPFDLVVVWPDNTAAWYSSKNGRWLPSAGDAGCDLYLLPEEKTVWLVKRGDDGSPVSWHHTEESANEYVGYRVHPPSFVVIPATIKE